MKAIIEYSDRSHRQQVIALWRTVFRYDAPHNMPELSIDKKLAARDGLFFVAHVNDQVVGSILAGYDGHRGWLYSVAVHPTVRKQGLGAALVRHAERALSELGCVKINLQILSDNANVIGFYESLGYTVEPRVSMGKKIATTL